LMPTHKLTPEIIKAAILGFEAQKTRIDDQIAELRAMLSGAPAESAATPETPTLKRRKFSAAARRRMKEAQQLRWAKIRGESEPPVAAPEQPKPKRKLSKAGRAAIVAALKKRWREKKAAVKAASAAAKKGTAKKAAAKKAPVKGAKKAGGKGPHQIGAAKAPETAGTATA
jgi:valyl-tRNA synthetase